MCCVLCIQCCKYRCRCSTCITMMHPWKHTVEIILYSMHKSHMYDVFEYVRRDVRKTAHIFSSLLLCYVGSSTIRIVAVAQLGNHWKWHNECTQTYYNVVQKNNNLTHGLRNGVTILLYWMNKTINLKPYRPTKYAYVQSTDAEINLRTNITIFNFQNGISFTNQIGHPFKPW